MLTLGRFAPSGLALYIVYVPICRDLSNTYAALQVYAWAHKHRSVRDMCMHTNTGLPSVVSAFISSTTGAKHSDVGGFLLEHQIPANNMCSLVLLYINIKHSIMQQVNKQKL